MEQVNKSVQDFNKAMAAKYRLISAPNRNTEAEIKKFQEYKSQENTETKGKFWKIISLLWVNFSWFREIKFRN